MTPAQHETLQQALNLMAAEILTSNEENAVLVKRIAELECENALLRKALTDAPHQSLCAVHVLVDPNHFGKCSCWKAALARIPEAKP